MALITDEFTTFVYVMLAVICLLSIAGFVSNLLFLQKILQNRHHSNFFTIMVCIADALNAFCLVILNCIHFVARRFVTGYIGCQIYGFQYQLLTPISVIAFLFTAVDPFLIVIMGWGPMKPRTTKIVASFIILTGILTASASFWGPISHPFVLSETGLYCTACYHCREPIAVVVALADAAGTLFNPMVLFCCMYLVRKKLISTDIHAVQSTTVHPLSERTQVLQKRIAERGLLLVSVQFSAYVCTTSKIIIELITGDKCPFVLDLLACLLQVMGLNANPVCFYILDGHASNHPLKKYFSKELIKVKEKAVMSPPTTNELSDTLQLSSPVLNK
jgi:hypothetical protein